MRHVYRLSLVGLAAVLFALSNPVQAQHPHAAHFDACAKACNECQRECDSCARHCAELAAMGKKEHLVTLGTCSDCAAICSTAARIVSRGGPLAGTICEACAKACATCGAACEKFTADDHMKRCAQECRRCERVCLDMLKHLSAK